MLYLCNTLRKLYPFDQTTSSVLLCLFWGEYNTNSWHLWYQYRSPTTALVRGELCSLGPLRHIFKPICFSCFHKAEECHQTSHHPTTTTLNLRWKWKCYNTVATATFDRNAKKQPTAESLHVLQLKQSTQVHTKCSYLAFWSATPLWSSRCQIVVPKPQQHWNQSTSLVHSPSIESCTWYSRTCKGWNKQAGTSSFWWAKRRVPFSQCPPRKALTKVLRMGSQSQPTLCAQTVLKLHNLQLANLRFWKIDRTSSGIERRHCSCFRVQMHKPLVHQWGNRGKFSWCFLEILTIS